MGLVMRVLFISLGLYGSDLDEDIKKLNLSHLTIADETLYFLNGYLMPDLDSSSYIDYSNSSTIFNQLIHMLENRMIYGQTTILHITNICNIEYILELAKIYRYKVVYVFYNSENKYIRFRKFNQKKVNNIIQNKKEEEYENWFNQLKKQQNEYETDLNTALNKYSKFILDTNTFNKYDDICLIPDLHGSYNVFLKFLKNNNMLQDKNKAYIFLGDYINRGEDSTSLIQSLLWLSSLENVYLIMGNHDLNLFNWAFNKEYFGSNFKKTIKKLERNKTSIEIENIKKSLCEISTKFKDYFYFSFKGEKYFINHAGIEKLLDNFPACYLNGKKTYGYFHDEDTYESYIHMGRLWKSHHPDIIQIFAHRNCFPLCLENNIKINDNVYCLESNVEYGDDLITFNLKNKNINNYSNPAKNNKIIKNNIKEIISEKEYSTHNIKSIIYKKNVFHKNLWNRLEIKAKEVYKYIDSSKIAARSYDKFFNINEHINTKLENYINNIKYPVKIYKKYNGFAGLVFYNYTTNNLEYAAKNTPCGEKYNKYLEELLNAEQKDYIKNISKKYNVTFLFECMHKNDNNHPVKIKNNHIILLDIIENTKKQKIKKDLVIDIFNYKELLHTAYNEEELLKLINYYQNSLDIDYEGVVLQDKNDKMVKILSIFYRTKKIIRAEKKHKYIHPAEEISGTGLEISLTCKYLFPHNEGRIVPIKKWQEITTDMLKKLNDI